jgi:hypothetical protein
LTTAVAVFRRAVLAAFAGPERDPFAGPERAAFAGPERAAFADPERRAFGREAVAAIAGSVQRAADLLRLLADRSDLVRELAELAAGFTELLADPGQVDVGGHLDAEDLAGLVPSVAAQEHAAGDADGGRGDRDDEP